MNLDKVIEGIRIKGKTRPRAGIMLGNLAKSRLAGLPKNEWPRATVYSDKKFTEWKQKLAKALGTHKIHEHVSIEVYATYKVPESYSKAKKAEMIGTPATSGTMKPDIDNALGAVMDALFPERYTTKSEPDKDRWLKTKKVLVEGTGDSKFSEGHIKIRWWYYDSIRIVVTPIAPEWTPWEWLTNPNGDSNERDLFG